MNFIPKNFKIRIYFTCALILLCFQELRGQFKYEALSTAQGLSQGYIWDIIQDRDGFLWISTKAGLNRYDGYHFKVYTNDAFDPHSILSNTTFQLLEDDKGRIWVTTDKGITIFDKQKERFHHLLHDPKNTNSLSGNKAFIPSCQMGDGRLLISASEDYFDIVTLPDDFFDNDSKPIITHLKKPLNSNNPQNIWNESLYTDSNEITWYNCDGKLYRFNERVNQFELQKEVASSAQTSIDLENARWVNGDRINVISGSDKWPVFTKSIQFGFGGIPLKEANGKLWITDANEQKLRVYDVSKWQPGHLLNPETSLIAKDDKVGGNKLFKDQTGLIWLGLNGFGLRKYSFESEKFNHKANGYSITKILIDHQNSIYLHTWAGPIKINQYGRIENMDWLKSNVLDDFISRKGDLWLIKRNDNHSYIIKELEQINLTTKSRKIFKVNLKGKYGHTQHILEDKTGNLWLGGFNGYFSVFNPRDGSIIEHNINIDSDKPMGIEDMTTTIYEDSAGIIWLGTYMGFAKIERKNVFTERPKVTWYENDPENIKSINNNYITSFLGDPIETNLLWISTKGGGLNLLDKSTGNVTHITTREGLCDNTVYGILMDDSDNIWGSTNNGLFCILPGKVRNGKFEIRHFTEAAGLQAAEFNTNAFARFTDGRLAFGGINGLNVFDPKEILIDTFAPNIFITKLLVGNQEIKSNDESGILNVAIEYTNSIRLNHQQDIFTLEFSALDFRAPDQIKYRYQLEGIDDTWIEIGNRRNVSYSHLSSGTYTFKVQGSNSLGIWNEKIRTLTIKVLPPWWATWYAYLFYILLVGLGITAYSRYKIHQNNMATQLLYEQNETIRIKELDKIKTHLFTNMTHEFRTPLTVIIGMVQQIRSSAKDHLDSGLDMIERNGNSLLRLVNEMLDLSKLEAGKMELNLTQGDVVNFIRYVVESFKSLAESNDKKLHYLSTVDVLYVKYDAEKLRQIVTNLMSNALKFTPKKGDIYISISREIDTNIFIIKVKDTGVGIPDNQIGAVFDRFYQADISHTRKAEGTGIGLALTKELVLLMGGEISVKSPPIGDRKGSEFTVKLPLEMISDFIEQPGSRIIEDASSVLTDLQAPQEYVFVHNIPNDGKELILLVEDNADVVAYTASCLQEYRLAVGKDGKEGYDIACDLIPDLIITDVMMPFMDGFEMTKKLKEDERTSHIPIIMLTAKADIDSKLEGIEHGAEAYLEKPFHKDELLLRIKKLLEQRKLLQEIYMKFAGVTSVYGKDADQEACKTEVISEESKAQIHSQDVIQDKPPGLIPSSENKFLKRVREEIERNLNLEDYNVDQMSKNLFMSYSQLHRKLNALFGHSPNQYIRMLRMQHAKVLLKSSDESIATIAAHCGFSDAGYFSKVFKQEFGLTPQEYRMKEG